MVKEILTRAGFVENKTFRHSHFKTPPKTSYVTYLDSYTRRGSDDRNLITEHTATLELYAYKPDPDSERRIESSLDSFSLPYEKQDCYYIQSEQLYQTVYTLEFTEK